MLTHKRKQLWKSFRKIITFDLKPKRFFFQYKLWKVRNDGASSVCVHRRSDGGDGVILVMEGAQEGHMSLLPVSVLHFL